MSVNSVLRNVKVQNRHGVTLRKKFERKIRASGLWQSYDFIMEIPNDALVTKIKRDFVVSEEHIRHHHYEFNILSLPKQAQSHNKPKYMQDTCTANNVMDVLKVIKICVLHELYEEALYAVRIIGTMLLHWHCDYITYSTCYDIKVFRVNWLHVKPNMELQNNKIPMKFLSANSFLHIDEDNTLDQNQKNKLPMVTLVILKFEKGFVIIYSNAVLFIDKGFVTGKHLNTRLVLTTFNWHRSSTLFKMLIQFIMTKYIPHYRFHHVTTYTYAPDTWAIKTKPEFAIEPTCKYIKYCYIPACAAMESFFSDFCNPAWENIGNEIYELKLPIQISNFRRTRNIYYYEDLFTDLIPILRQVCL